MLSRIMALNDIGQEPHLGPSPPVAVVSPALHQSHSYPHFPSPQQFRPMVNKPKPPPVRFGNNQTIYRGKLINRGSISSKPTAPVKGVRKYNHIPWTTTGLRKAETMKVVKEEKGVFECDICGVAYEKFRSLQIHKQRNHNVNMMASCPECGKKLSTQHAIKKHLLSHRPEEEWPYECPLCHKKFQARGDIPKHLKTSKHANDNIPTMGTKQWFDLIYHDKEYDYEAVKKKIEKQEAQERSKLPPGAQYPSVIDIAEQGDDSDWPSRSLNTEPSTSGSNLFQESPSSSQTAYSADPAMSRPTLVPLPDLPHPDLASYHHTPFSQATPTQMVPLQCLDLEPLPQESLLYDPGLTLL